VTNVAFGTVSETEELNRPKTKGETSTKSSARKPRMVLRSQVHGRERWYVDILEDNPRLAAAVELVLRTEEGIEEASANPLTGRVLVSYQPHLISQSVETSIQRAIGFGPMTGDEFAALRVEKHDFFSAKHLVAAEIACFAIKTLLIGGCCPLGLTAAGALLLGSRRH
jgi:hypothetical protein